MQLPHLALTVIEDPEHGGAYHWLLLQSADDGRPVEHSASEQSFPSALQAFQAGANRWIELTTCEDEDEDEDTDPAGDNVEP